MGVPSRPLLEAAPRVQVGCVALSAATAVLNSGPPVTSTKSSVRARRRTAGLFAGAPTGAHAAAAAALGRGQRERELGVRLQVLHARVEGRDAHVRLPSPAGEAHGVAERYPAIEAWVEIVDIVPQVMLRTIQRARGVVADRGHRHAARRAGPPGRLARNGAGERQEQVEVVPAMLVVPKDFRGHRPGAKARRTRAEFWS